MIGAGVYSSLRARETAPMRTRVVVLVAVGALALVACGSDDDADVAAVPSVGSGLPASTAANGDGDGETEPVRGEIVIEDFTFVGDQQVPVGGTVVVTNTDAASHTWSAADGSFDSGTLAEGESFEYTFDESGTFEYRCDIHPTMTGTIEVTG